MPLPRDVVHPDIQRRSREGSDSGEQFMSILWIVI